MDFEFAGDENLGYENIRKMTSPAILDTDRHPPHPNEEVNVHIESLK